MDAREFELYARLLDQRAIGGDRRLERLGRGHRDVEFLAGDEFALEQRLEPLLLHLGILQLRGVPGELSLSLPIRRLEGAGIDLEQQLSRLDRVSLLELDG